MEMEYIVLDRLVLLRIEIRKRHANASCHGRHICMSRNLL